MFLLLIRGHAQVGVESDQEGFDLFVPGVGFIEGFEKVCAFAVGADGGGEVLGLIVGIAFFFVGEGAEDAGGGIFTFSLTLSLVWFSIDVAGSGGSGFSVTGGAAANAGVVVVGNDVMFVNFVGGGDSVGDIAVVDVAAVVFRFRRGSNICRV